MGHRVVCISRTIGAGGEPVGRLVAQRLGIRYFDDEVIALASEKAGVDPATVAGAEHHSSLLSRLMDALFGGSSHEEEHLLAHHDAPGYYASHARPAVTLPQEELRRFIQAAIVEIADRGSAVIVAHAASQALAKRDDVLRVLVTASTQQRSDRLWLESKLLDQDEAVRAVAESDRERQRYLQRFFDLDAEPPTLYDLVINTDALRPDQAVAAIVGTAQT